MAEILGKRAAHRAEQIAEIKRVARELIVAKGAEGLSLREIAREMGLASSALYRYFATRDELLTTLILDAYNDLGQHVESAYALVETESPRRRFIASIRSIRAWALANPSTFALLYGTPVRGYEAPTMTIAAASRVTLVLASAVNDNYASGVSEKSGGEFPVPRFLVAEAMKEFMPSVPAHIWTRTLMAWTEIFGSISMELFGHYVGSVSSTSDFFEQTITELADWLGFAAS